MPEIMRRFELVNVTKGERRERHERDTNLRQIPRLRNGFKYREHAPITPVRMERGNFFIFDGCHFKIVYDVCGRVSLWPP